MAQRISNADFKEKALQSEKLTIVDFYSDSCIPCKQLAPVLGDIEDEYEDVINVYKVNINFDSDLAQEYGVMSAPTLILFKNGEKLDVKRGIQKKADLVAWIEEHK